MRTPAITLLIFFFFGLFSPKFCKGSDLTRLFTAVVSNIVSGLY